MIGYSDLVNEKPIEPSAIYHASGERVTGPHYWHVYGGPAPDHAPTQESFLTFVYGPVERPDDDVVRARTVPWGEGTTFHYLGSFTHDPTQPDINSLIPEELRS